MHARSGRWLLVAGLLLLTNGIGCSKKVNKESATLAVTIRASQNTSSIQGNGAAVFERAGISQDGRYVAFTSKATNLVPNDLNNASDVFYRDNLMKTTVCVSVTPTVTAGVPTDPATGPSGSPSISNDGKYVCFVSSAPDVTSDSPDVGTQLAQ